MGTAIGPLYMEYQGGEGKNERKKDVRKPEIHKGSPLIPPARQGGASQEEQEEGTGRGPEDDPLKLPGEKAGV